jgi:hypothetical protein
MRHTFLCFEDAFLGEVTSATSSYIPHCATTDARAVGEVSPAESWGSISKKGTGPSSACHSPQYFRAMISLEPCSNPLS